MIGILVAAAHLAFATGEDVAMTQTEMNILAAKDRDAAISDLGREAAALAFTAPTAAEADRILGEFRRTMERCLEKKRHPRPPDSGTIAPLLDAFDIEEAAQRQLCVWKATPEQRARWDAGVAEASGFFRETPFRLRDGQAVVTAAAGRFWTAESDFTQDPEGEEPARQRQWLLETYPQWSVRDGNRTLFVLKANALDADGHAGFGDPAQEDTLLLYWRDDRSASSEWGRAFLGNRLTPLADCTNAVSLKGKWLSVETTWRSTEKDGIPVIYEIDEIDGEPFAALHDYSTSLLHDGKWFLCAHERDALQPNRYASPDCKKESSIFYALWRHPLPENALVDFMFRNLPPTTDCFQPIRTLDAEHLEFFLPKEIGGALAAIYEDRATFENVSAVNGERPQSERLAEEWRKEDAPPLLTVRQVADCSIGNSVMEERVDFSFSRDGAWLVVEPGYRIPETKTPDGIAHSRAQGMTVFRIPENRREAVRALLDKAAGQPADWAESFKGPDGKDALGFLVVERLNLGVDDDDHRPGADDLRSKAAQAGVKAGDVLLSFCGDVRGTDLSKRMLRESCEEYSKGWENSDGDCWFARMRDGTPEVFSCGSGELFQCEVASGTAFLRVAPRRFSQTQMNGFAKALSDFLESHPESQPDSP